MPDYTRLKSSLLSSGIQHQNPALFQVIDTLLTYLSETQKTLVAVTGGSPGGTLAETFLTKKDETGTLPNSLKVEAGAGIQFNDVGNRRIISSVSSPIIGENNEAEYIEGPIIPGQKGDIGPIGLTGIPGIDGEEGPEGMIGPQGLQGISGKDGLTIPGIDGIDGNDGEMGLPGPIGPSGPIGLIGPPGIDGLIDDSVEINLPLINTNSIGNFTTGSVLFADSIGNIGQDNANFFWDDTNNRLGIGTNTPSDRLHVIGNGNTGIFETLSATNNYLRFRRSGTDKAFVGYGVGSDGLELYTQTTAPVTIGVNGSSVIKIETGVITLSVDTNFVLSGGVNGLSFDTDTLSIDATNHRVGIGLTDPTTKLNISDESNTAMVGGITFRSPTVSSTLNIAGIRTDTVGNLNFDYKTGGVDYTSMTIQRSSGNVGIGTTGPSKLLSLYGASNNPTVYIDSGSGSGNGPGGLILAQNGTPYMQLGLYSGIHNSTNTNTELGLSNSSNLVITGGNVGIGTTNPGSKLAVVGLPTSSAGLSTGDFWNNGGVVSVV